MRLFHLCRSCVKRDYCTRNQDNVKNTCKLYSSDPEVVKKQNKALTKLNEVLEPLHKIEAAAEAEEF